MAFAILIAVGAWLQIQASGGMEKLKNEASSLGSSAGAARSASPAPAAPPEPPSPPAPAAEDAPGEAAASESESYTDTPSTEREA
jgi:hypothetical protein